MTDQPQPATAADPSPVLAGELAPVLVPDEQPAPLPRSVVETEPSVSASENQGDGEPGVRRSGLRNPEAAVRGLGSGTLILEAIVLLLAIAPIRVMAGGLRGWGTGAVVALAVVAVLVSGMMKRPWAWHTGTAIQVLLLASGFFHWSLAVLGVIFGGAWGYATYVRHTILG